MRAWFVPLAALALAGCGSAEKQPAAPAPDGGANATNYVEAVSALSERERDAVFYRAIHDAGLPCQQVVKSEAGPPSADGAPSWQAQCEDGGAHLIVVKPDGTAMVVSGTTP